MSSRSDAKECKRRQSCCTCRKPSLGAYGRRMPGLARRISPETSVLSRPKANAVARVSSAGSVRPAAADRRTPAIAVTYAFSCLVSYVSAHRCVGAAPLQDAARSQLSSCSATVAARHSEVRRYGSPAVRQPFVPALVLDALPATTTRQTSSRGALGAVTADMRMSWMCCSNLSTGKPSGSVPPFVIRQ